MNTIIRALRPAFRLAKLEGDAAFMYAIAEKLDGVAAPRTPHNDGVMVRVWEYDVPETSRTEFERTYGAAGDWVQLFLSSDGFRGTELFVSLSDPGRYLTVDRFTDEVPGARS